MFRSLVCFLFALSGCSKTQLQNPCIEEYPRTASEVLISPAGTVKSIEKIEWFEDGVYRIIVASGGEIFVKPDGLPLPSEGVKLEMRIFSTSENGEPLAGCYCQTGTDLCLEEYSYP